MAQYEKIYTIETLPKVQNLSITV